MNSFSKQIAVLLAAFVMALAATPATTFAQGTIPCSPVRLGHIPQGPVEGISTSPGAPVKLVDADAIHALRNAGKLFVYAWNRRQLVKRQFPAYPAALASFVL